MQNPPPATPASSAGIDKRTGALLIYLLTWVGGLLGLFVWKNDPDLKYHGGQSVVLFGALTIVYIISTFLANLIGPFGWLALALGIIYFVYWVICMYKAWTGGGARFQVPLLGGVITPYAEQLSNSV